MRATDFFAFPATACGRTRHGWKSRGADAPPGAVGTDNNARSGPRRLYGISAAGTAPAIMGRPISLWMSLPVSLGVICFAAIGAGAVPASALQQQSLCAAGPGVDSNAELAFRRHRHAGTVVRRLPLPHHLAAGTGTAARAISLPAAIDEHRRRIVPAEPALTKQCNVSGRRSDKGRLCRCRYRAEPVGRTLRIYHTGRRHVAAFRNRQPTGLMRWHRCRNAAAIAQPGRLQAVVHHNLQRNRKRGNAQHFPWATRISTRSRRCRPPSNSWRMARGGELHGKAGGAGMVPISIRTARSLRFPPLAEHGTLPRRHRTPGRRWNWRESSVCIQQQPAFRAADRQHLLRNYRTDSAALPATTPDFNRRQHHRLRRR